MELLRLWEGTQEEGGKGCEVLGISRGCYNADDTQIHRKTVFFLCHILRTISKEPVS